MFAILRIPETFYSIETSLGREDGYFENINICSSTSLPRGIIQAEFAHYLLKEKFYPRPLKAKANYGS